VVSDLVLAELAPELTEFGFGIDDHKLDAGDFVFHA